MSDIDPDARRESGLEVIRRIFGEETVERYRQRLADPFSGPIVNYGVTATFGDVWARPGLDLKTRSMLCIAMLTALRLPNELKNHVNTALNNGVTVAELTEILLHTAPYCGGPATGVALTAACEVLKARGLMPP